MNSELRNLLERIEFNENIGKEQKELIISYIRTSLFSKVRVFSSDEYNKLEKILEDLDYDQYMFETLLEKAYIIGNTIGRKKNFSPLTPKMDYVYAVHTIFKDLNMDLIDYDESLEIANIAIARTAYRMAMSDGILNNEISFVDLTKKICDEHYEGYEINKTRCVVLKLLHRVDMGLKEFEGKYKSVVTSEEFISMFENYVLIDDLHFSDLVKEFYPTFHNELFTLIKEGVKDYSQGKPDTEYVFKYLNNIKKRREEFAKKKEKIVKNITRIDVDTKKSTEDVFSELIESIGNNRNININVNKNIINNINNVFDEYSRRQRVFVEGQLTNFFDNCSGFINDLIIPSSGKEGIDELISQLVGECKDFFIEYDSKKFKEIIDYVLENTDLSVKDLKEVGKKCAAFFKDADIRKLKEINSSLNEFKDYVNQTFKNNEIISNSLFDSILINNPNMLLKDNKIREILSFLKGELSLSDKGYHYKNVALDKNILGIKFYKKIIDNDCEILFNSSLERVINNFNYLEGKCRGWNIDFKKFKFNEDMIYAFLEKDMYEVSFNSLDLLLDFFDREDFKKIVESNPDLLSMPRRDLAIIIKRCILNENSDYNFYDLLASELYYYSAEEYINKSDEELAKKSFKYVDLGIDSTREFDVEDVLTLGIVDYGEISLIIEAYSDRKQKIEELNSMLLELKGENIVGFSTQNQVIEKIVVSYNSVYGNVPCVSFKNSVLDLISMKKENYEYQISDAKETLEAKNAMKDIYSSQKKDSLITIRKINEILDTINSAEVKSDVVKFLNKVRDDHKVKNEIKEQEIDREIKEIEQKLRILDREVEYLSYLFTVVNFEDESLLIDGSSEIKKSFSILGISNSSNDTELNDDERIEQALNGKNVIVFSKSVDLSDIPNDKDFVDKVYKFLGDTDFSIRSWQFMKSTTLNKDFVEKLSDPRSGIWARRENGTPVRVYFIPIHTKYFTCYYVIGVNYKDHAHLDGGCSSDDVYKKRMQKAKSTEAMLEELSIDELMKFVKEKNAEYEEKMKPIISKIEIYEKKKNKNNKK